MTSPYLRPDGRRRVVVTGMGAVTPLGNTLNDTWHGLIEGVSTGAPVARFDASLYPSRIAYEVRDFAFQRDLVLAREEGYLSTAAAYGIQAGHEALRQARLAAGASAPDRTAVCVGVGMCCPDVYFYDEIVTPKRWDDLRVANHIRFFPDQLSSVLARIAGAKGGITTIHTACASSGQSLGEAFDMIAYGDQDVVLTGGADSMIHPFYFAGFSLLGALSKRNDESRTASRPFAPDRDGFVLGEGACMLVFEDMEHAMKRGAVVLAEVCGYGITESAYRITDLHPEGTGPVEAMQMAVDGAGIEPAAVGYINAHGTSTPLNDRIEALAISKVFGFGDGQTLVSSTKSMTGHMISAAGAIEFAVCVQALRHQVLPPSINVPVKDPECLVELTPPAPTSRRLDYALSNSVGFGGSNTALIAGRVQA
jgi:3-oxoacyl-[acyl-carrier-protein] synthase II